MVLVFLVLASASDVTPPEVIEASVTPDPATQGSGVRVEVRVVDDEAVDSVAVFGRSPSGRGTFGSNIWDVAGDVWSGDVDIPPYCEGGTWTLTVEAWDATGNHASASDLLTFEVASPVEDLTPPVVSGVVFDPPSAEVGVPFLVQIDVDDDLSGVAYVTVEGESPTGASRFAWSAWPDAGGVWSAEVTIPPYSEPGTWTVQITATDASGNPMEPTGTLLEVVGGAVDVEPPVIHSVSFDPPLAEVGGQAFVSVHVTDDLSGVGAVTVWGRSPSLVHSFGASIWDVEGDVWSGFVDVPPLSETGVWTTSVSAVDVAGNEWVTAGPNLEVIDQGPVLTLVDDEVFVGVPFTLQADVARAGETVAFYASSEAPAPGPCPTRLGGLCLDVAGGRTVLLGLAVADARGRATLTAAAPKAKLGGAVVTLQAALARGVDSVKSDVVSVPVLP